MGISADDRQKTQAQTAMLPIVGLTDGLPKNVLEDLVIEAIYKHRYLRDIAELRHTATRRKADYENANAQAHFDYVRAMSDMHAQQTVLSTLLAVLGYVPKTSAD